MITLIGGYIGKASSQILYLNSAVFFGIQMADFSVSNIALMSDVLTSTSQGVFGHIEGVIPVLFNESFYRFPSLAFCSDD